MNPEQLAKLNGPKTEVADSPHVYGGDAKTLVEETEETTPSLYRAIVEDIPYGSSKDIDPNDSTSPSSSRMVWMDFSKTPVEEVDVNTAGFVQVVGDDTPLPEVTYTTTWPVTLEGAQPQRLGPGLREQLKDEAFATQFTSPLDVSTFKGKMRDDVKPYTKKKKHRR